MPAAPTRSRGGCRPPGRRRGRRARRPRRGRRHQPRRYARTVRLSCTPASLEVELASTLSRTRRGGRPREPGVASPMLLRSADPARRALRKAAELFLSLGYKPALAEVDALL